jgi:cytochrome b involved in lipid metabolism
MFIHPVNVSNLIRKGSTSLVAFQPTGLRNFSFSSRSPFSSQHSSSAISRNAAAAAVAISIAVWINHTSSSLPSNQSLLVQCHGCSDRGLSNDSRRPKSVAELWKSLVSDSSNKHAQPDVDLDKLPVYTAEEVAQRDGSQADSEKRIWISLGGLVFDVTDFIPFHPGGTQRISRAAGAALEPYWILHQQHYDTAEPMESLTPLLIGRLDPKDQERVDAEVEELQRLQDQFELTVSISSMAAEDAHSVNNKAIKLSLKDIHALPKTDLQGQIGCPQKQSRRPVSTNLFGGVRMEELLQLLGMGEMARAAATLKFTFHAMDGETVTADGCDNYQDILICYEMNGAPLTQQQGFPLRVMVPGKRVIKWVQSIRIIFE